MSPFASGLLRRSKHGFRMLRSSYDDWNVRGVKRLPILTSLQMSSFSNPDLKAAGNVCVRTRTCAREAKSAWPENACTWTLEWVCMFSVCTTSVANVSCAERAFVTPVINCWSWTTWTEKRALPGPGIIGNIWMCRLSLVQNVCASGIVSMHALKTHTQWLWPRQLRQEKQRKKCLC